MPTATDAAPDPQAAAGLFADGMARITLPIWLVFMLVLLAVYLMSGWVPLLVAGSGFSVRAASLTGAGYHVGGVCGGIVASFALQRMGWGAVAVFSLLACVVLAILALSGHGDAALVLGVVCAGFFVTGTQNAINGAAGVSYPTPARAKGLGWALGIGRIGSILGPLAGSAALWLGITDTRQLFALPILPLAIAALTALYLRGAAGLSRFSSAD